MIKFISPAFLATYEAARADWMLSLELGAASDITRAWEVYRAAKLAFWAVKHEEADRSPIQLPEHLRHRELP